MKKLFLITIMASVLFACEENTMNETASEEEVVSKSVETLVLKDAEVEEAEEMSDYEVDFFSCTKNSISEYIQMWLQLQLSNKAAVGGRYETGQCPFLSVDEIDNDYPKTITIDYGDGIELFNGRIISGKIVITLSAPPFTNGSTREVTYEDFTIDSLSMSGIKTMTYEGTESTRIFNVSSEMAYTFADGSTVTRTVNKTKEWVAGLDTEMNPFDDVIEITGSVEIVDSEDNVLLKEISETDPLVKTGSCMFITEGVVTFYKNEVEIGNLDYGDGECDFKAELTLNGITEEIFVGLRFGKCGK